MGFSKKYPAYKDSGVAWLGEVPGHWEVKRLKYLLSLLTEKTDRRINPVALENIESWSGRFIATDSEFSGEGVAFIQGDMLFGKLRPYLAKVLLADSEGEAVGDFHVMRPSDDVAPRFVQYQLLNRTFIDIVDGSTFGSKMPRASWEFVGSMPLTIPPMAEQTAIATFLDHETAKIDALVAEQQRLIELLQEKRQAVISHAVTKGLDPSVSMKDSGVEWLGEVPAHWEVRALRRVIGSIEQGWSPACHAREADEQEWGVLKAGCLNGGLYRPSENKALPSELEPQEWYEVRVGDVLMSRASGSPELVGSTALVTTTRARLMLSDKIFRLQLHDAVDSRFFVAALNSRPLRVQIENALSGGNGMANNLPQSSLLTFVMPVPPLAEQGSIATFLDHETTKLDALVTEAHTAITLLQERRTALISAAVTGQIDVRGWEGAVPK